ncbi:hypothetical protein NR798_10260 [Archangium gephyra]|uniref:hypothetical protein n=1 Tax=Archangium gephyra TaxID=48 RepID=UPI0035D3D8D6
MKRWMLLLWVSMCACVGGPSTRVYGAGPARGRLEQSMDSASSACRQNPAYCTAVAGEETVLPIPVSTTPLPVAPESAAPAKDNASEGSKDKTTELSWQEFKKICYAKYTGCLDTAVQGIDGPLYKHSQCVACRDVCMQNKGAWPSEANGKPCP